MTSQLVIFMAFLSPLTLNLKTIPVIQLKKSGLEYKSEEFNMQQWNLSLLYWLYIVYMGSTRYNRCLKDTRLLSVVKCKLNVSK